MAAAEATHSAAKVARAMVARRIVAGEFEANTARDGTECAVMLKQNQRKRTCVVHNNKCLPRNSALADDLISAWLRDCLRHSRPCWAACPR